MFNFKIKLGRVFQRLNKNSFVKSSPKAGKWSNERAITQIWPARVNNKY